MPIKDLKFKTIKLSDSITGKTVTEFNNVQEVNIETNEYIPVDTLGMPSLHIPRTFDTTITINTSNGIDVNTLTNLFGLDKSKMPDMYDISFLKPIQARKHKKKRINKKWLKRYGYKFITVECKGWKLCCKTDGTVEFVKTSERN